jgi:hypothetical protein
MRGTGHGHGVTSLTLDPSIIILVRVAARHKVHRSGTARRIGWSHTFAYAEDALPAVRAGRVPGATVDPW